ARTEIVYPLDANISSGSTLRQDRVLSTQLVAIKGRQVLTPVASKFHMSVDALSKKILASVLQDSEVIRIEADDASQAKALAIVTAVSTEYLKSATSNKNAAVEGQLAQQISAANAKIATLTIALNAAEQRQSTAEVLQLQTQLNNETTQLNNETT